jgi:hypothetical protein
LTKSNEEFYSELETKVKCIGRCVCELEKLDIDLHEIPGMATHVHVQQSPRA